MPNLTPKLNNFYKEIQQTERSLPPSAFLLLALTSIAKVTSISRLKVSSKLLRGRGYIFANIYSMIIAHSGSGKDLLYGVFNDTTAPLMKQAVQRYDDWRSKVISDLALEAEEKFPNNKQDRKEYIRDNSPRNVVFETEDGTPEGLMDIRSAIGEANMGGIFIHHSEFAQVFENDKQDTNLFLEVIKKGYEGDTPAKVTRNAPIIPAVKDVPMNMLVYTAPINTEDESSLNKFINFLAKGYARRMYFCKPNDNKYKPFTFEESLENYERQSLLLEGFRTDLESIYNSIVGIENNIFKTTIEVDKILYNYQQENLATTYTLTQSPIDQVLAKEMNGRHWRALKVAGLIAIYEHPDNRIITTDDVNAAIWITEQLAKDLEEILNYDSESGYKLLFELMMNGENHKRTDFYEKHKRLGISKNDMKKFLEENLPLLQTYAPTKGYQLIEEERTRKQGGNVYKLEPIAKEESKEQDIIFSYSTDLAKKYEPATIGWKELHKVVTGKYNYSFAQYKNKHRTKTNATGEVNAIALDIDDGWSMKEAEEFLKEKNIKALIATTKSHQKAKNGVVCDRFRIVMPLSEPIKVDDDKYSNMMIHIHQFFDEKPDSACKDISRFYFGNNGEYKYLDGKAINGKSFIVKENEVKYIPNIPSDKSISGVKKWATENYTEGQRNRVIYWAGGALKKKGLSESEILDELNDIMKTANAPELDQKELTATLKSTLRNH